MWTRMRWTRTVRHLIHVQLQSGNTRAVAVWPLFLNTCVGQKSYLPVLALSRTPCAHHFGSMPALSVSGCPIAPVQLRRGYANCEGQVRRDEKVQLGAGVCSAGHGGQLVCDVLIENVCCISNVQGVPQQRDEASVSSREMRCRSSLRPEPGLPPVLPCAFSHAYRPPRHLKIA